MRVAVDYFVLEDLDVFFDCNMLTWKKYFKPCKRGMVPSDKEMTYVKLEHEHFESYLVEQLKNMNKELKI